MPASIRAFLLRISQLNRGKKSEAILDRELEFHLQMEIEDNLRRGMGPTEARRRALIALGGVEQTKEEWRDAKGTRILHDIFQDSRYALRGMKRSPIVTVIAVLSLALGIGANTAIFSLLDAAMIKTLPVRHPEQLVTLRVETPDGGWMSNVPSELFDEVRKSPRAFSGVFAFWRQTVPVQLEGDTFLAPVQTVSGDFFATLGVQPELGRLINRADDDAAETAPVAVISHAFWVRRFGADRSAIGRTIYLNSRTVSNGIVSFNYEAATIVGVTPPEFFGADRGINPDITIPLGKSDLSDLWVMGRLKPGVSEAQARAEVNAALHRAFETIRPRMEKWRALDREEFLSLRGGVAAADKGGGSRKLFEYREQLLVLMLLSGVVLLIACVNIANLLMARSAARSQEIGMRLALGAGRARLLRQLLTESWLLSLLGTVMGIFFAFYSHGSLAMFLFPQSTAESVEFTLDLHVLAYTVGIASLCTLLFGLMPALQATRVDVISVLKRTPASTSRLGLRPAKALIVAQVAISLLLVVDAGLLSQTLYNLHRLDAGFDSDGLIVLRINIGQARYEGPAAANFYREIVSRTQALPGVISASVAANSVFGSGGWSKSVWVEGRPSEEKQYSAFNVVGPDFFSTTRIPVLLGREFTDRDVLGTASVIIVNEAFARRYLTGLNPIGRHVSDGRTNSEVIGVVKNAKYGTLRDDAEPMIYEPLFQEGRASGVTLHVRSHGNPAPLLAGIRERIHAFNPALFTYDARTLTEVITQSLQRDRMMAALASFFGLLAMLLTCIGLYGVIAFAVARRTKEVGVRMALGADCPDILRMVLRETLLLVLSGSMLGIPAALASASLLRKMLFGLRPDDPATIAGAVLLLLAVGAFAGYLPARRAARVDAMSALRWE